MGKSITYLVGLGLFFSFLVGEVRLGATPSPGEVQGQEQALRKRVEELYSLMQLGKWTQAEAYLTEDSREAFRNESKNPFFGFQVESVKLDPDGQTAKVVVRMQILTTFSPTPITVPRESRWRLVDGIWYVVIPKPDLGVLKKLFESPDDNSSPPPSPPPEELKFKGHRYNLAMIQPGQVKTARFPFANVTDHVVTLTEVLTGCKCLRVKLEKKTYKPGESGELAIEFDPTNYERDYEQTILVKTDPGGLTTYLVISGYVVPREPPKPPGEGKPL